MKVKNEIVELNLGKSLLVVMGSHHGVIHEYDGDEVNQVEEIRIDTPTYSDNEGMFRNGGGENFGYGSVLEPKKEKAQKDFSKEMVEKIDEKMSKNDIRSIYLYAPAEMKSHIESDWPTRMTNCVKMQFDGNLVTKPAPELLDMIKENLENRFKKEPTGEAKAILDRTAHLQ